VVGQLERSIYSKHNDVSSLLAFNAATLFSEELKFTPVKFFKTSGVHSHTPSVFQQAARISQLPRLLTNSLEHCRTLSLVLFRSAIDAGAQVKDSPLQAGKLLADFAIAFHCVTVGNALRGVPDRATDGGSGRSPIPTDSSPPPAGAPFGECTHMQI
jgi:hypothetical protein